MDQLFYCPDCDTTGMHSLDGREATCQTCGSVREVEADQVVAVVEMEPCGTCRQTMPVGHVCDPTPCLRKTGLWPCGTCAVCLAAQQDDLAARQEEEAS